jgi:hypothetical protein
LDAAQRGTLAASVTYTQITVDARRALLDALVALRPHRDAVVLVGAQAVYLYTGDADIAIATSTKDSDIVLIPDRLAADPILDDAMASAGFVQDLDGHQGTWLTPDGIPVELLVPSALQPGNTRGARIPPHGARAARRVSGLEATAVDYRPMTIASLDPADDRRESANVAGPSALLVAKMHKIGDRVDDARAGRRDRTLNKDAHDVYRLLRATSAREIADGLRSLRSHEVSGPSTQWAIDALARLATDPTAPLCAMAGQAVGLAGLPEQAALLADSTWVLVQDVLELIR